MYNTRFLKAKNLAEPKEWHDLLKPEWYGNVGMTSPSRSGTQHLTVETILQGEGWDEGWNTIFRMAGNSSALTERSFGVPDGINNGQFGAGPVIDFFGLSSKFSNFPVEFVYPETTAIVPANIALISGAKNTGEGRVTARETNKVSLYVDAIGELHIPVNGEAPEDDVLAASFRPHTLQIHPADTRQDPKFIWLPGIIEASEFLGEFTRYQITSGNTRITADQTHFSGQVKLKTGQAVALALPPSQIRLLPTSTTRIA